MPKSSKDSAKESPNNQETVTANTSEAGSTSKPKTSRYQRIRNFFAKLKPSSKIKKSKKTPLPVELATKSEVQLGTNSQLNKEQKSQKSTKPTTSTAQKSQRSRKASQKSQALPAPLESSKSAIEIASKPETKLDLSPPKRDEVPDVTIFEMIMTRFKPAKSSFKKKPKRKLNKPRRENPKADIWNDYETGQSFPPAITLVRALFQPITTLPGEKKSQYVACRYLHGNPVMGRVWNDNGKIAASFPAGGRETRATDNAIPILILEKPSEASEFIYDWRTFAEAVSFDEDRVWRPVVVGHQKGSISPGVIIVDGVKILGQVDIRNERAIYGYNGEEKEIVGPEVRSSIILCRKNI